MIENPAIKYQEDVVRAVEYYHCELAANNSTRAIQYLQKRRLYNEDAVSHFKIGFAERGYSKSLPDSRLPEGKRIRDNLRAVGILRPSGNALFSGSLVIPVFDLNGYVVQLYGRKINHHMGPGADYHHFLPHPSPVFWNHRVLLEYDDVILCESFIDGLSFWVAGHRNVVALQNESQFLESHLRQLVDEGIRRVYIAFDRDRPGEAAANTVGKMLGSASIAAMRIEFPLQQDANDVLRASKDLDDEMLGRYLETAVCLTSSNLIGRLSSSPLGERVDPGHLKQQTELSSNDNIDQDDHVELPSVIDLEPGLAEYAYPSNEAALEQDKLQDPVVLREVRHGVLEAGFGDRQWTIRGFERVKEFDQMRVTLKVAVSSLFHLDSIDLCNAKHRRRFIEASIEELSVQSEILAREMGRILGALEERLESRISDIVGKGKSDVPDMSDDEREAALHLLKAPNLIDRVQADITSSGIIGEDSNKLVCYLSATSRKLEKPLAVIVQSSSSAGKTSLMDAVLKLMPAEDCVKYSAVTSQTLFYMQEQDLKHKILAIAEEEGAVKAAYAIKILQSDGELKIATTARDSQSGTFRSADSTVNGPVMVFLTTTAVEIDDELQNRCIVLSVNESREQTRSIHQVQRRAQTLDGLILRKKSDQIAKLHQNAQRLLRPLCVVNPFAEQLNFLDHATRSRRDHMKYLGLINAIAFLHQYQRTVESVEVEGQLIEYVVASKEDVELATKLIAPLLCNSLNEVPPQTRRLYDSIVDFVRAREKAGKTGASLYRFSRRQLREHTGLSDTTLKLHLNRLVDLEYLLLFRGVHGRYMYELLDIERVGIGRGDSQIGRGVVGVMSAGGQPLISSVEPHE